MSGRCEMKNRGYQLLTAIPTTDLVRELKKRVDVELIDIGKGWSATINHEIECWNLVNVPGPATILVIPGVE